jgi:DNA-binding PadR family transcriptional regulator
MSSYWRNGEPNWRRFEQMARKGWGRVQNIDDELGNLGGNFRIGRMLASGDVRLVALYLIDQQPRHGYDLIKAVEERSGGVYSPSPGIVYPALTYLEEAGYVTSSAEGNKKLYTIKDEGRAHLAENREAIAATLDFLARTGEQFSRFKEFVRADWPFGGQGETSEAGNERPEPPRPHGAYGQGFDTDRPMKDAIPELDAARKALKAALKKARHGSHEQQARAAEILRRAAAELDRLAEDDIDL